MKAFIDRKLVQIIATETDESKTQTLLKACNSADISANGQHLHILFGWPSLFEYIDLGTLFETFPKFDAQSELYTLLISILKTDVEKEILYRLYDQVFVECLTQAKALPQIDATFLIDQIQKRQQTSSAFANELLTEAANKYEKYLTDHPRDAIHDLILYLAWDRVCVYLAIVFEYPSTDPLFIRGLKVLKECLLESFQHITKLGRTAPGFFRLLESLYAHLMREENLQSYSEQEWLTLCQSSSALKPREELADVFYVDAAIVEGLSLQSSFGTGVPVRALTMETADKVESRLGLAKYMLEKLKFDVAGWPYTLAPMEIICLKEFEEGLRVNTIVRHRTI